jgi:hypothetical protein
MLSRDSFLFFHSRCRKPLRIRTYTTPPRQPFYIQQLQTPFATIDSTRPTTPLDSSLTPFPTPNPFRSNTYKKHRGRGIAAMESLLLVEQPILAVPSVLPVHIVSAHEHRRVHLERPAARYDSPITSHRSRATSHCLSVQLTLHPVFCSLTKLIRHHRSQELPLG